jgi:antitoxin component YwqK of YwqJK toxin-antitoxin module
MILSKRPPGAKYYFINYYYEKEYGQKDGLFETCSFKGEEMHGIRKRYYKSGKLMLEDKWVDGELHGWEKTFSEDGILEFKTKYVHGVATELNCYYDSGELMEEGVYIGEEYHTSAIYNKKGQIVSMIGAMRKRAIQEAAQNKMNYQILLKQNPRLADFKKEFNLEV